MGVVDICRVAGGVGSYGVCNVGVSSVGGGTFGVHSIGICGVDVGVVGVGCGVAVCMYGVGSVRVCM